MIKISNYKENKPECTSPEKRPLQKVLKPSDHMFCSYSVEERARSKVRLGVVLKCGPWTTGIRITLGIHTKV